ncbi:MAG: alpha/beta fold hydrolase [Burkholderiaceae bacterium]|nr:alpha/beta fold hydrolase [Burkholderiaceae bacterium]MEB2351131.1 haloalkane dehalogenase [Burkholderiaceae bacterium]
MATLRTPDERFDGLLDFPFVPHYLEDLAGCEGMRVHYVDEGVAHHGTALCLHGNPTWSYLYRRMIPVFAEAGLRVVAPDLIGFGRSDKPTDESTHRFDFHRSMLMHFVERLDLHDVMLVVQDWGGLLGLTLPPEMPGRFTRLLAMNTALAVGIPPTRGFIEWRAYSNRTPDLAIGRLLMRGKPDMSAAEASGYDAPFPDAHYKAGPRAFPNLVPDSLEAPGAELSGRAGQWWRESWSGRSFMAIGLRDPVLGEEAMLPLRSVIRGCPEPMRLAHAGHFVPEWGGPVARAALAEFDLRHLRH